MLSVKRVFGLIKFIHKGTDYCITFDKFGITSKAYYYINLYREMYYRDNQNNRQLDIERNIQSNSQILNKKIGEIDIEFCIFRIEEDLLQLKVYAKILESFDTYQGYQSLIKEIKTDVEKNLRLDVINQDEKLINIYKLDLRKGFYLNQIKKIKHFSEIEYRDEGVYNQIKSLISDYNKTHRCNLLIYGQSGSGKTFIAESVSTLFPESNIYYIDNNFIDYISNTEKDSILLFDDCHLFIKQPRYVGSREFITPEEMNNFLQNIKDRIVILTTSSYEFFNNGSENNNFLDMFSSHRITKKLIIKSPISINKNLELQLNSFLSIYKKLNRNTGNDLNVIKNKFSSLISYYLDYTKLCLQEEDASGVLKNFMIEFKERNYEDFDKFIIKILKQYNFNEEYVEEIIKILIQKYITGEFSDRVSIVETLSEKIDLSNDNIDFLIHLMEVLPEIFHNNIFRIKDDNPPDFIEERLNPFLKNFIAERKFFSISNIQNKIKLNENFIIIKSINHEKYYFNFNCIAENNMNLINTEIEKTCYSIDNYQCNFHVLYEKFYHLGICSKTTNFYEIIEQLEKNDKINIIILSMINFLKDIIIPITYEVEDTIIEKIITFINIHFTNINDDFKIILEENIVPHEIIKKIFNKIFELKNIQLKLL